MNNLYSYVADITTQFGHRPAGSQDEEGAALYAADVLDSFGIPVDVDSFNTSGPVRVHLLISYALIGIPCILSYLLAGYRLPCAIIALVGMAFLILNLIGKNPLIKLLARKRSQNIVARYIPEAASPVTKRKKIIIVAHADAPKAPECALPPIASSYALFSWLYLLVCVLATAFSFLVLALEPVMLASLVLGIVVTLIDVVLVVRNLSSKGTGANDGASGIAAMLGVAESVVSAGLVPVSEYEDEQPDDAGYADDERRFDPDATMAYAPVSAAEMRDAQADDAYGAYAQGDEAYGYEEGLDASGDYAQGDEGYADARGEEGYDAYAEDGGAYAQGAGPADEFYSDQGYVEGEGAKANALTGARNAITHPFQAIGRLRKKRAMSIPEVGEAEEDLDDIDEVDEMPAAPVAAEAVVESDAGRAAAQDVRDASASPASQEARVAQDVSASQAATAGKPRSTISGRYDAQPKPRVAKETASQNAASSGAGAGTDAGAVAAAADASAARMSAAPTADAAPEPAKKMPSWWRKVEGDEEAPAQKEKKKPLRPIPVAPNAEEPVERSQFASLDSKLERRTPSKGADQASQPVVRSAFADAPAYRDTSESGAGADGSDVVRSQFADIPAFRDSEEPAEPQTPAAGQEPTAAQTTPAAGQEPTAAQTTAAAGQEPTAAQTAAGQDPAGSTSEAVTAQPEEGRTAPVASASPDGPAAPVTADASGSAAVVRASDHASADAASERPQWMETVEDAVSANQREIEEGSGQVHASSAPSFYRSADPQEPLASYSSQDAEDAVAATLDELGSRPLPPFLRRESDQGAAQGETRFEDASAQLGGDASAAAVDEQLNASVPRIDEKPDSAGATASHIDFTLPSVEATAANAAAAADQDKTALLDLPVVGLGHARNESLKEAEDGFTQRGLDTSALDESGSAAALNSLDRTNMANATGTFAPLSATGIMAPVSVEKLEEYSDSGNLVVEDVDDSEFDEGFNQAAYGAARSVEVPKSRLGTLFGRNGKRGHKGEEEAPNEWLGLDDNFDARSAGKDIGSWDNFDESDDDASENSWRGGAYGAPTPAANRHAVSVLSNDLLDKEIWFVVTGGSTAGNSGMRQLLAQSGSSLRNALIINLDSVGAGVLSATMKEGALLAYPTDRRLQKMVRRASDRLHLKIPEVTLNWRTTDATCALEQKYRAISLVGLSAGALPQWRTGVDNADMVDPQDMEETVAVVLEMIKNS